MNSALTNYYLQQLGIKRWELRNSIKFAVFTDSEFGRAQNLFKNILVGMQIVEKDLAIFTDLLALKKSSPKIIIALGESSANQLLNTQLSLQELRTQACNYNGIPVLVSEHPMALLLNPKQKKEAYQDWLKVGLSLN